METEEDDISPETLSAKERKLIASFRKLTAEGQASVLMHAGKRGKISAYLHDQRVIMKLRRRGVSDEDIAYKLGLAVEAVKSTLPYSNVAKTLGY